MRGVYTAEIKISGTQTMKGLMLLTAPSTKVVEILSAMITTAGSNVTNQQLEARLARVATLGSPVGTAVTPNPEENGDQASGVTCTGNLGTDITAYGVNLDHQGFASLAGYQFAPVPEERPIIPPSGSAILQFPVAPGVAVDAVVQVKFREIG